MNSLMTGKKSTSWKQEIHMFQVMKIDLTIKQNYTVW